MDAHGPKENRCKVAESVGFLATIAGTRDGDFSISPMNILNQWRQRFNFWDFSCRYSPSSLPLSLFSNYFFSQEKKSYLVLVIFLLHGSTYSLTLSFTFLHNTNIIFYIVCLCFLAFPPWAGWCDYICSFIYASFTIAGRWK